MEFLDNFDQPSFDPRWAIATATLDTVNNAVTFVSGALATSAGAISESEFDTLEVELVFNLSANYTNSFIHITSDALVSGAGIRLQVNRGGNTTNSGIIGLAYASTPGATFTIAVSLTNVNLTAALNTVKLTRNSAGQVNVLLNGVNIINNSQEPAEITSMEHVNAGLHFTSNTTLTLHSVQVSVPNVAPVLDTPQPDVVIQADQSGVINAGANFSDPNNDTLTFSILPNIALVDGFAFNTATGAITYTAPLTVAAGVEYTITASDGELTASDVFAVTVIAPQLRVDSVSNTSPVINAQITVDHSNALDTLTTPNFNIASQTGTQAVIDIPDITTFVLAGQTWPTINFNEPVAIPLSDGANTDNVDLTGIQNPAGTYFGEITSIDPNGVYANDVGVAAGMFGYFFNVVGNLTIFPESGVILSDDNGGSCQYKLYNGEWGSAATVTINAVEPEPDVTPPVITLNGANPLEWTQGVAWVDPGATVTDNVDATRQITADTAPDINMLGQQVIAYNTQDTAGNAAVQVTRTVNVVAAVVQPTPPSENPENTAPAQLYVRVGTPYEFSQHVINPDDAALNYAVAQGSPALPEGVTLNASTGTLTATTNQYAPVNGLSIEVTLA